MLENPDISDQLIASAVRSEYGITPIQVTFLPLGYDSHTAVYRLAADRDELYFLKLRSGKFRPVTVTLPHFLHKQGMGAIIPPIETTQGGLFGNLAGYTCILYPFIQGRDGYQVKLSGDQWIALGKILRQVHETKLSPGLSDQVPCEIYDPQWRESTLEFLAQVETTGYTDPVARQCSAFLAGKKQQISRLVARTGELAAILHGQPSDLVLCHSDAHPGNYLVSEDGVLYLVDWDNPIFAPRERDLMCIGGGMSGDQPGGREEQWFYQGYGAVEINRSALAYFRYERIIQDIAEFCKTILLTTNGGADRAQSYRYLTSSFDPGSLLDAALQTDMLITSKR